MLVSLDEIDGRSGSISIASVALNVHSFICETVAREFDSIL